MSRTLIALSLFWTMSAAAQSPEAVEQVRQAELGFAKAFADRDQARFFSYVAEDATFMSARRTLRGKKEVISVWSNFFKSPEAPFFWAPDRVVVSADEKLGFSMGPLVDPQGKIVGNYFSTWRREPDGSWKVIFDGPGGPSAFLPEAAPKVEQGMIATPDGVSLHYRKIGNAPLTLIVPLAFVMWDDFRQLSDMATIISYDPRNRARSTRSNDASTWTIEKDVQDLETVRKHFKVAKFVPVGFSYLGQMVIRYTLQYPQHVERVVQIGPAPYRWKTDYPKHLSHGMEDIGAPESDRQKWNEARAAGAIQNTPKEYCQAQWAVLKYMLVGTPSRADRIDVSFCEMENEWPKNTNPLFQRLIASMNEPPLTLDDVRKVKAPVLIIHGTKDRNVAYGAGREWALHLPEARLVTVPGAAHSVWVDDPLTVFGAMRGFLRGEWPLGAQRVTKLDPQAD